MDLFSQKLENLSGSDKAFAEEITELCDQYHVLESRNAILCQLNQLNNDVNEISAFFKHIYQIITSVVAAEQFYVVYFDPAIETIEFPYSVDRNASYSPAPVPIDTFEGTLFKYVLDTRKPLLANQQTIINLVDAKKINPVGHESLQFMGVPLKKDGYIMGLIAIQKSDNSTDYSEQDLALLSFIAQHMISGINRLQEIDMLKTAVNARTCELMQNIREREKSDLLQDSLFKISELTNEKNLDISDFYSKVHNIVGQLINASNFSIAKYSPDKGSLTFVYYVDQKNKIIKKYHAPRKMGKHLTELVIRSGEMLLLSGHDIEDLYNKGEIDFYDKETTTWLGVPLIHSGNVLGVMIIQSYQRKIVYKEQDAELLNFVSTHISSAIRRRDLAALERQTHNILEEQVKLRTIALEDEISQRKKIQEKLTHAASHDELTGLANRIIFNDLLNHAIASNKRFPERVFALLFLDLDRFKVVNDSLGHHAGDILLKIVADELVAMVRNKDTVARFGGDEFVILIEDIQSHQEAYDIASRITNFLSTPFVIEEQPVYIGASMGVLFNNERYDNADFMLRDADTAMYHAKDNGRGRYEVFDSSMHSNVQNALVLEADIREAIEDKEFIPFFQPIVNLVTGKVIGFEALARWKSKKRGFVFPNDFIPLAEERNLIIPIDFQILTLSCYQLKAWQKKFDCGDLYISCNLYCEHFFSVSLAKDISEIIEKVGILPSQLRIELTERALLDNNEIVLENMNALKKLGVKILLDDFGTGYSSLSYLHLFPIDVLKIDRSFITNVHAHTSHQAIIKTIIDLATNLGMTTVGEGIEGLNDAQILKKMTCQYGQGYYFAKPMEAIDAEKVLFNTFDV